MDVPLNNLIDECIDTQKERMDGIEEMMMRVNE